ncbi:MAG TPA: ELWxxDGT repeat protein [Thermoanaerobaculia bacterium]|nr:ELWxxDGT repeat protein [Thermoanaerobaculia bacterium]
MVRTASVFLCFLFLLAGAVLPVAAETASLVADINPGSSGGEGVVQSPFLPLGDKVLFTAWEPGSGSELWVSDGTSLGTELVWDFCPGECSSSTSRFLGAVGRIAVLYLYRDAEFGPSELLWGTDGTKEGTLPLTDPQEGPYPCSGNEPPESLAIGRTLFFAGRTEASGCELWATDGTRAGTRMVKDSPALEVYPSHFVEVAGRLFFFGYGPEGLGLWVSDGTAAGTVFLAKLPGVSPRELSSAVAGSRLFFILPESRELWVSDGTPAGTKRVDASLSASQLAAAGDAVYFIGFDEAHGGQLWRTDGTVAGTKRLTGFSRESPFASETLRLAKAGERVVFLANADGSGSRLWTSRGTLETTAPLSGCPGGCPDSPGSPFLVAGDRVMFTVADFSQGGFELWSTDGTGAGTRRVHDLCPGVCDSEPVRMRALSGKVYFLGQISGGSGLFRTDGTPQGTVLLASLGPKPLDSSEDFEVAAAGRKLYFRARAGGSPRQIWASDGTPRGTSPVTLLGSTGTGSSPLAFTPFGGDVLFHACDGEERSLFRSDGTAGGTRPLLPTSTPCGSSFPEELAAVSGIVFFPWSGSSFRIWRTDGTDAGTFPLPPSEAADVGFPVVLGSRVVFPVVQERLPDARPELWESDGSIAGTRKLLDLPDFAPLQWHVTAAGSRLYFIASEVVEGRSQENLWVSDGTVAGTRRLTSFDIHPVIHPFSEPVLLAPAGGLVYFVVNFALWRTDGTPEGTGPVLPSSASPAGAAPWSLTEFQGSLYFLALAGEGRRGLWRTNGTAAGTVLLKALGPVTPYSPEPGRFTVAGNQLFFVADDGEHGVELWVTDGTAAGTRLVRDVAPGKASSKPQSLGAAGGQLFFSASDGEHGFELWESDGTEAGTRMVQDLAPGGLSSHPKEPTAAGNRLFFSANDGVFGSEPWVLPLSSPACQPSDTVLCLGGGRFKVEASWRDFEGKSGRGHAIALTADTGYFWFFDPANVEVIAKVLDGQGVNGHHWVFYGALSTVQYTLTVTDTQTGAARRYVNPPGRLGSVGDTNAFGPLGATGSGLSVGPEAAVFDPIVTAGKATGGKAPCVPSATRLCLAGGRFAVTARWKDFDGNTGDGKAVPLTGGDTGYFWFFGADNVEVVLKVLDGRGVNGKFWVFYGALSSVEYTLTVTDTETGAVKTYTNPAGRLGSVADTGAF